jgi:uncharacterized protein DUF4390
VRRGIALIALWSAATTAQRRPQLEITLPSVEALATDGPTVRALNVLSDPTIHDLLDSGFPTRLHFRVELWSSGGWFNSLRGSAEWDQIVRYDPLAKRYRLVRLNGGRPIASLVFGEFAAANAEVERAYRVPITALRQRDRQYYNVALEVETMSLNDLDELERWLHGELQPAVRGERNPGTAVGRGLRELFARLLGAERRNLEVRSKTFRVP